MVSVVEAYRWCLVAYLFSFSLFRKVVKVDFGVEFCDRFAQDVTLSARSVSWILRMKSVNMAPNHYRLQA